MKRLSNNELNRDNIIRYLSVRHYSPVITNYLEFILWIMNCESLDCVDIYSSNRGSTEFADEMIAYDRSVEKSLTIASLEKITYIAVSQLLNEKINVNPTDYSQAQYQSLNEVAENKIIIVLKASDHYWITDVDRNAFIEITSVIELKNNMLV